jgi:hypothetical protein
MPGRNGDYIYSTMLGEGFSNICGRGVSAHPITVRVLYGVGHDRSNR